MTTNDIKSRIAALRAEQNEITEAMKAGTINPFLGHDKWAALQKQIRLLLAA